MRPRFRKDRVRSSIDRSYGKGLSYTCDGTGAWKDDVRIDGKKFSVECRQGSCRLVRRGVTAGVAPAVGERVQYGARRAGFGPTFAPERLYGGGVIIKK